MAFFPSNLLMKTTEFLENQEKNEKKIKWFNCATRTAMSYSFFFWRIVSLPGLNFLNEPF